MTFRDPLQHALDLHRIPGLIASWRRRQRRSAPAPRSSAPEGSPGPTRVGLGTKPTGRARCPARDRTPPAPPAVPRDAAAAPPGAAAARRATGPPPYGAAA